MVFTLKMREALHNETGQIKIASSASSHQTHPGPPAMAEEVQYENWSRHDMHLAALPQLHLFATLKKNCAYYYGKERLPRYTEAIIRLPIQHLTLKDHRIKKSGTDWKCGKS
jgi:hypothetical protein